MTRELDVDLATAAMVATDLAAALGSLASHARTHCRHGRGIDMAKCDRCAARVRAIDALDDLADATGQIEIAIEHMLCALDGLGESLDDDRACATCDDTRRVADRAEHRYLRWIDDASATR